ncbi:MULTISPECIES: DUF3349 domain-containing protein [unclassified Mycobacterium]|uniref:DUF3349 domain-containing protein n=1 Tax=unclassified Mycobacterium TaxID=2642494 RepID=UPI0003FA898E|nr:MULTISPECIES: DUF3349 domain-containing protein [unclassified Mycobacterium]OBI12360.1 hypothetical protein A5712_07645 [Mycobacterium sp. E2327]
MVLRDTVSSIIAFLRAGYPSGAPALGYAPVLALLPRRVCDDEVTTIATALTGRRPIDDADVGAEILRVTDELPAPDDVDRVQRRLDAMGWA